MSTRRLPGDWAHTADAEAAVDVPPGAVACTHFAGGRVVATTSDPTDPARDPASDAASDAADPFVLAHETRCGGRVFAFPGRDALESTDHTLSADDVVRMSAVDVVVRLGGGDVRPDETLHLQGFVRPRLRDGRLELVVRPAVGGHLVPFEQREQIACCADHG